ncbi:MAG TPA: hypothetical protein VEY30_08190 [Myxococcaceae bacterium]|nr:hypothetical protein [Myxococcaceae bacterium]
MKLGEMLVRQGLAASGVEGALESQIIHGGRLGTNLIELGWVDERAVAAALGEQHRMAFAFGEMVPEPDALKWVVPAFAEKNELLPLRVTATRLTVALVNPKNLNALDTLAFRTGKRVVPVVVPEFRMDQLLRLYLNVIRPVRAVEARFLERPRRPAVVETTFAQRELISEEDVQALHSPPTAAPVAVAGAPDEPALPPAPASETAPISFQEAQRRLSSSSNREDVARTVLHFAQSRWKRAVLFSVQDDWMSGWRAAGEAVRESAVQRIGVSLKNPGTFKLVRDTRAHYVGPVREVDDGTFYQGLGAAAPRSAVLLPLLVRGQWCTSSIWTTGPAL